MASTSSTIRWRHLLSPFAGQRRMEAITRHHKHTSRTQLQQTSSRKDLQMFPKSPFTFACEVTLTIQHQSRLLTNQPSATPPPPPPPHSLSPGAAALHPDSHTIRLSKTHIEKLTNHTAATGATAAAAAAAGLLHSLSTPLGVR
ncbi:unnamed protein product [Hydatigera taeniaeformis]|uniref:Uncharacterized protein n=1 Tax=Hydatigena taeniaeformis TaxID=6205 RepID=A0A0R3X4Q7_HYDTA|nr:unnamed protein product [Hydatigera taeniaeformis]